MISEFDLLAGKIADLAELTQVLRRENADVRVQNAELIAENKQLKDRMNEAKQRVAVLIETIPAVIQQQETIE